MKKLIMGILLASLATIAIAKDIDVNKVKETAQSVIVSLTPTVANMGVDKNVVLKAMFNVALDAKHVQKNNVKLKYITQTKESMIAGEVAYVESEQAVTFTPSKLLEEGYYEVEFKSLKAIKSNKSQQIKEIKYRFYVSGEDVDTVAPTITLNGGSTTTLVQGSTYTELGAVATDDKDGDIVVNITGSVDTSTEGTYIITYTATDNAGNEATASRTVSVIVPTLASITLESDVDILNVGESTTLMLTGNYSDDTTTTLAFTDIEWIVSPTDSVQINNNVLTATKESKVTLQAKLDTLLSNTIEINIATVINGYVLPTEPDPALNNATLLGVDSNDNGVRDDVEIYIIKRYASDPKYPKTKTAIALQYAWASQKILESPTIDSKKYIDDAIDCESYWADLHTKHLSGFEYVQFRMKNKVFNDPETKDIIYNTRERINQKFNFNTALSGNIFDGRDKNITNCQTNIDKLGE